MKGNISATRVAIFGNMSTHPELETSADPADGFHKALCSCFKKKNKPQQENKNILPFKAQHHPCH